MMGLLYPRVCGRLVLRWIFYYMSQSPVTDTQTKKLQKGVHRWLQGLCLEGFAAATTCDPKRDHKVPLYYCRHCRGMWQWNDLISMNFYVLLNEMQYINAFFIFFCFALLHSWNNEWQSAANNTYLEVVFIRRPIISHYHSLFTKDLIGWSGYLL